MMMIQLLRSGVVAMTLAAICLAGCGLVTPAAEPSAAHQTTVRVADIPLVTQVPFYVGLDRGALRDKVWTCSSPTSSTSDAVTLVATSKVELGGFGRDRYIQRHGTGIGMKMLASAAVFADGTRASGLVVRQDLIDGGQYHRPADLRGKRIAVSAAQSQFYVELTLARDGVQAGRGELREARQRGYASRARQPGHRRGLGGRTAHRRAAETEARNAHGDWTRSVSRRHPMDSVRKLRDLRRRT